jgi:hypothetical protein
MQIKSKIAAPEALEGGSFNNGDIYIPRKAYRRGNRSDIYYFTCGQLIGLPAGNSQFNVEALGLHRHDYVNVTSKFTLMHNELLEQLADKIMDLNRQLGEVQTLNEQLIRDRGGVA